MYVAPDTESMLALCTDKASDRRIGVARLLIEMLFCLSLGEANVVTFVILPLAIVTATCTGPQRVSMTSPSNEPAASPEAAFEAGVAGAAAGADVTGVLAVGMDGFAAVAGAAAFAVVIGVVAPVVGATGATGVVEMVGLVVAILPEVLPSVSANNALSAPAAVRLTATAAARLPRAA